MMNIAEKKLLLKPSSSSDGEEIEEYKEANDINNEHACNMFIKKKVLSKQLSMRETWREAKWENRRRQIINRRRRRMATMCNGEDNEVVDVEKEESRTRGKVKSLTDEDLDELRGSIELGFGFNEKEGGHDLCDTLPALGLYFAINRQLSDPMIRSSLSHAPTPTGAESTLSGCGCETPSPTSPQEDLQQHGAVDWKICNPGDNPQHVKTRLRHWAQVVACSARHYC